MSLQLPCAGATLTVTVDPAGGDDLTCLSVKDLAANASLSGTVPCRTLNKALGAVDGVSCQSVNCTQGDLDNFTEEALILLADGEHRLKCKPCLVCKSDPCHLKYFSSLCGYNWEL